MNDTGLEEGDYFDLGEESFAELVTFFSIGKELPDGNHSFTHIVWLNRRTINVSVTRKNSNGVAQTPHHRGTVGTAKGEKFLLAFAFALLLNSDRYDLEDCPMTFEGMKDDEKLTNILDKAFKPIDGAMNWLKH